ncbi:MAG: ATP-binding protein [Negativicutes bacterium]|nr:ATP-binding protein [Negativicutes bacterium]
MYSAQACDNKLGRFLREEEYQDYFTSAKSGMLFLDAALRVKNINRETEIILGVERGQLVGKRAESAFQSFGDKFLKIFAIAEYEDFYTANVKIMVNEQPVFLHVDALKLRDARGELSGVVVVLQDVSAVKASIKQIQTTEMLMSLGELASGIADHVRTPLNSINSCLKVMVNRVEGDGHTARREILATLLDEASYINNVVKELILFTKLSVDKQPEVNVNRVLEEALLLTFKQLGGEQILIDKHLTEGLPTITADANLLKQAMVNIIQNAVEAMPEQGSINLRTWPHAELNMMVVAIADSGPGISPQIMPRIFEPFYTTKTDRIGLGLSVSQRIIHEHGGFIDISADPVNGTKVHIYLPVIDNRSQRLPVTHQQLFNLQ